MYSIHIHVKHSIHECTVHVFGNVLLKVHVLYNTCTCSMYILYICVHVIRCTSYACAELTNMFSILSESNENRSLGPRPSPLSLRGNLLSLPVTSQKATLE